MSPVCILFLNLISNVGPRAQKKLLNLKTATQLDSEKQFTLAQLSAAHTQMIELGPVTYEEYRSFWEKAKIPIGSSMGLFMEINRVANYLSPITAARAVGPLV